LEIGMYDAQTMQRPPIVDATGTLVRDALAIAPITVQ